jgi:ABC-type multidrug transport system fused ATPase/permease subunit
MDVPETPVFSRFTLFNVHTNQRIYQRLTSQIEHDRVYIEELQQLLRSHGIEVPESSVPSPLTALPPSRNNHGDIPDRLMPDGSIDSLMKSVTSIKEHNQVHEIYVQYRNLTLSNMVRETKIATVGSTVRNMFIGSGAKRRVDVIKDLTGRILPKTMTLLMGPPGCGKCASIHTEQRGCRSR